MGWEGDIVVDGLVRVAVIIEFRGKSCVSVTGVRRGNSAEGLAMHIVQNE